LCTRGSDTLTVHDKWTFPGAVVVGCRGGLRWSRQARPAVGRTGACAAEVSRLGRGRPRTSTTAEPQPAPRGNPIASLPLALAGAVNPPRDRSESTRLDSPGEGQTLGNRVAAPNTGRRTPTVASQRGLRWSRRDRPAVGERVPALRWFRGSAAGGLAPQPPPDRSQCGACRRMSASSAGCGGLDKLDRSTRAAPTPVPPRHLARRPRRGSAACRRYRARPVARRAAARLPPRR
jgi:hypothetical protein